MVSMLDHQKPDYRQGSQNTGTKPDGTSRCFQGGIAVQHEVKNMSCINNRALSRRVKKKTYRIVYVLLITK